MQAIHEHENRVSLKPPYIIYAPFSLWIEVLMMWYWKLLKDPEHIISPQNALSHINWSYYSWISKIVNWFGVWNSAHISCKCSVHGVISPSYYQGHNASNSFSLQTNNLPFLWFVYFKLPFIPCATFIWKNVDDIWGFLLRCGCSWRETRSSTTLPPSSTSARQVRPREKSALFNSRKYQTQTHQCVCLSVCFMIKSDSRY